MKRLILILVAAFVALVPITMRRSSASQPQPIIVLPVTPLAPPSTLALAIPSPMEWESPGEHEKGGGPFSHFGEAWLAEAEKLTEAGWTVELMNRLPYGEVILPFSNCRLCISRVLDHLTKAPSLKDPICELLIACLPEEAITECAGRVDGRSLYLPAFQEPQSREEAASMLSLAADSADRVKACEALALVRWARHVPVSDLLEPLLAAWTEARQPLVRTRAGEMIESLIGEGSLALHERVAGVLLERWDQETAEGSHVGMHSIADWLLSSSSRLERKLTDRIRDRLIQEFCDGYESKPSTSVCSAADTLNNSPGGWSRLAPHLPWLEKTLSETREPWPTALTPFAPHHLWRDESQEAIGYAAQVSEILIRTFPEADNGRRVAWIWAIHNAKSPQGIAFLNSVKSQDPDVISCLERARDRD